MFTELDLKPSRQKLKEFANGMIVVSLLANPLLIYFLNGMQNHLWATITASCLTATATFIFCRLFWPIVLKPLYVVWTGLSMAIGVIVGPIVLTLVYFLVITPVGLLSRMTGKVWIETKEEESYWKSLEPHSKDKFERQF